MLNWINPVRKFARGFKSLPNYIICFSHLRPCGRGFLSNGVRNRKGFTPLEINRLNRGDGNIFNRTARKGHFLSLTGFTFIEIAIALALLIVVLLGMMEMFSVGIASSGKSRDQTIALNLAREKAEEKLDNSVTPTPEARLSLSSPYGRFDREVTVADYLGYADLKEVKVTVYWTEGEVERAVEIVTLVAEY